MKQVCCCCWVASVVTDDSVRPHRQQPTRLPHPWDSPDKNTGVGCHFLLQCMKVKSESEVAQSFPTPWDPMDCSLPGSSVHGIFQARVLEWGAIAFSLGMLKCFKNPKTGNSLVFQWLGLWAFTAKGLGSVPGWGTKIPQATKCGKKKKNTQKNTKNPKPN